MLPTTPDWPAHIPLARWVYRAVQLLPARARMFQGDDTVALAYLERLCAEAAALGANGLLISALALQALALEQLGRRADALDTLQRALTLAEPEGYIRSIIDTGPGIRPLLRALEQELLRAPGRNDALRTYLHRLSNVAARELSAAPAPNHVPAETSPDRPFAGTLTSRELAILRLLAAGYSNQQIADQLVIAVSTVKWYLRLIYDKLGVINRTQAVVRARDHGLLHR
jgi:LuxR family maltose regulon positive regulatory protein